MLLHYLGKLKLQFFADIQQIWKKLQTNRYISVFKIATLSPYWLQINAPCHCSLTYLLLQSISGSRCYQSCAVLLVTCTCSSRIVPQLTALVTLSSYCSRRLQSLLHLTCGHKQPGLKPNRLLCLRSQAGMSFQDCSVLHSWPQAARHRHLVEHSTPCHQ